MRRDALAPTGPRRRRSVGGLAGLLLGLVAWYAMRTQNVAPSDASPGRDRAAALEGAETAFAASVGTASRMLTEALDSERPAPETRSLVETEGGRFLTLRLVEWKTHRPLADFALLLRQEKRELEVITDDEGRARFLLDQWQPVHARHLPRPEPHEYASLWGVDPSSIDPLELQVEGEALAEHVLVAHPLTLVALAVLPDGSPIVGAAVSLQHGWRDLAGGFHSEWIEEDESDELGRAHFSVEPFRADVSSGRLYARGLEQGLASASTFLDPPFAPGPWRLEMVPTGRVVVRAFDREGQPLKKGRVALFPAETPQASQTAASAFLDAGSASLLNLWPGLYHVRVSDSEYDRRTVAIEVLSGQETAVQVRFDDGSTALAAAGRVVDERGRGLAQVGVWYEGTRYPPDKKLTDFEGRFRFFDVPGAQVRVSVYPGARCDEFEPAFLHPPFGNTELRFERTRELSESTLDFVVRDAESGVAPESGWILVVPPGAHPHGGWALGRFTNGRAAVVVKSRPGLVYRVRCEGYLDVSAELTPGETGPIQVALRRGFLLELSCLDGSNGLPLAGARIVAPGVGLQSFSDGTGVARLRAPRWPDFLRVSCDGYREQHFVPRTDPIRDRVELQPLASPPR